MPKWIAGATWCSSGGSLSPFRWPGHPPAPDFGRLRRIREVHDHVELVVVLVVRHEIRMGCAKMRIAAVHERHVVHADGVVVCAGQVVERDLARLGWLRNVVDLEARGLATRVVGLVCHQQDVAAHRERVAAHSPVRERQLPKHLRFRRLGDVENRERRRPMLVGDVHVAPAILDLHCHAFAKVGRAAGGVLREQFQVVGESHGHCCSPLSNRPGVLQELRNRLGHLAVALGVGMYGI